MFIAIFSTFALVLPSLYCSKLLIMNCQMKINSIETEIAKNLFCHKLKKNINKFNKLCKTKSKQKSNLFNFVFHFGFFFGYEIIASNILKFGDKFLNGKLICVKTETYDKLN